MTSLRKVGGAGVKKQYVTLELRNIDTQCCNKNITLNLKDD